MSLNFKSKQGALFLYWNFIFWAIIEVMWKNLVTCYKEQFWARNKFNKKLRNKLNTISELNTTKVFIWFNLLMTWVIQGCDHLISIVENQLKNLKMVFVLNLRMVNCYFWSLQVSDPSRLIAKYCLQFEPPNSAKAKCWM